MADRSRNVALGGRGESLADTARRVGAIGTLPVAPIATDAEVLTTLAAAGAAPLGDALKRVQGAPQQVDDLAAAVSYEADPAGRVVAYRDASGEQHQVGNPHGLSTQALLRHGVSGMALLPAGFTPLSAPIPAEARYVWAGMRRELRPDPTATSLTGYGFQWPPDPVPASQVRRARGSLNVGAWATDQITVANGPCVDYFRVRQYRDLSPIGDRKTAATYHFVNSIGRAVDAYAGTQFAISKATDMLGFTLVGYVDAPFACMQMWSPEAFVEDTGELMVVVSINTFVETYNNNPSAAEAQANPGNLLNSKWGYHFFRITDLDTAKADYVGKLEGSAFPVMANGINAGHHSMIDPFVMKRLGVYYAIWKAEAARDNPSLMVGTTPVPHGTLGWAASTRLLGAYDAGAPFRLPDGSFIRGEGQHIVELPVGFPRRYRLIFDDFLNLYGGGTVYADTDDFVNFPAGVQQMAVPAPYNRHATFVVGL